MRTYLAQEGMRKGGLSKFVEDAVRWRVLDRTVARVKARNVKAPPGAIEAAIDEALSLSRADRFRSRSSRR